MSSPALGVPEAPASAARRSWSLQLILFAAGALLMPLGLFAIWVGWYGAAHAKYGYDQFPYLISGGVFGLGLLVIGGFLYFGSWLAKIANDQAVTSQQIATALALLAEHAARDTAFPGSAAEAVGIKVVAGRGRTVHLSTCALISQRSDLRPVSGTEPNLTACRVCRPVLTTTTSSARTKP